MKEVLQCIDTSSFTKTMKRAGAGPVLYEERCTERYGLRFTGFLRVF